MRLSLLLAADPQVATADLPLRHVGKASKIN